MAPRDHQGFFLHIVDEEVPNDDEEEELSLGSPVVIDETVRRRVETVRSEIGSLESEAGSLRQDVWRFLENNEELRLQFEAVLARIEALRNHQLMQMNVDN
jgi:hypothetical protein